MDKKAIKLSEYEIENISEQLAQFFYSFWTNRNNNRKNLNTKTTVLNSGSLEGYPDNLKQ